MACRSAFRFADGYWRIEHAGGPRGRGGFTVLPLRKARCCFAGGFGWRSAFGRLELSEAERAAGNGEPVFISYVIVVALALAFGLLFWSLWLAYKQAKHKI